MVALGLRESGQGHPISTREVQSVQQVTILRGKHRFLFGSISGGPTTPGSPHARLESLEQHGEWLGVLGAAVPAGALAHRKGGRTPTSTPTVPTAQAEGLRDACRTPG